MLDVNVITDAPLEKEAAMHSPIAGLVAELLAAWNSHDIERVETFYASAYVGEDVGQARPQHGPQERSRVLISYIRAFPDLHFTGETIVEGNRAAIAWTMTGTHRGTLMHIPPTGRHICARRVAADDREWPRHARQQHLGHRRAAASAGPTPGAVSPPRSRGCCRIIRTFSGRAVPTA